MVASAQGGACCTLPLHNLRPRSSQCPSMSAVCSGGAFSLRHELDVAGS